MDRTLTSPHCVAIFDGGHVWLSSELALEAVEWIAADFRLFNDVSSASDKAAALRKEKNIRDALNREKAEENSERPKISELLERGLADHKARPQSLSQLRDAWKRLGAESATAKDSSAWRIARRVTRGLAMSARERTTD